MLVYPYVVVILIIKCMYVCGLQLHWKIEN